MRQIKFRAWDRDKKEMLIPSEMAAVQPSMTWSGSCYRNGVLQNYEMMQFTGLLDRNRKEIHEGDIVRFEKWETYTRPEFEGIFQGVVKFNEEHVRFDLTGLWPELNRQTAKGLEVIGNVHENFEFLKD